MRRELSTLQFYKPSEYFADKDLTIPKEDLTDIPKLFSMDSLICLQIDDYLPLQKLLSLSDYNCVFHMGKARLGNQGVRANEKRAKDAAEAAIQPLGAAERIAAIQSRARTPAPRIEPTGPIEIVAPPPEAIVEKVTAVMAPAAAPIPPPPLNPLEFKAHVEQELLREPGQRRFNCKSDANQTIIYDCDDWLRTEVNATFDEIRRQNDPWMKLAGIARLHVSSRGIKIICVETPVSEPAGPSDRCPVENVASTQIIDTAKPPRFISPLKFKTLVERELAQNPDTWRFKSRSDKDQRLIYDCEDWLQIEAKATFEEIQNQNEQWMKLAGIVRLHVADKGTKIIYIEKAVTP